MRLAEGFTWFVCKIRDPLLAYNPYAMMHTKFALIISKGFSHAQQ
jgi:hypothetical protein